MEGQPLVGTGSQLRRGCGVRARGLRTLRVQSTALSTDMYYINKLDASLVISVSRLDRDNKSQSTPILSLVSKTILSALGSR